MYSTLIELSYNSQLNDLCTYIPIISYTNNLIYNIDYLILLNDTNDNPFYFQRIIFYLFINYFFNILIGTYNHFIIVISINFNNLLFYCAIYKLIILSKTLKHKE